MPTRAPRSLPNNISSTFAILRLNLHSGHPAFEDVMKILQRYLPITEKKDGSLGQCSKLIRVKVILFEMG